MWEILGIEPTSDLKAIKRAYTQKLRHNNPEDSAEAFGQLREAYEHARHWAERMASFQPPVGRDEEDGIPFGNVREEDKVAGDTMEPGPPFPPVPDLREEAREPVSLAEEVPPELSAFQEILGCYERIASSERLPTSEDVSAFVRFALSRAINATFDERREISDFLLRIVIGSIILGPRYLGTGQLPVLYEFCVLSEEFGWDTAYADIKNRFSDAELEAYQAVMVGARPIDDTDLLHSLRLCAAGKHFLSPILWRYVDKSLEGDQPLWRKRSLRTALIQACDRFMETDVYRDMEQKKQFLRMVDRYMSKTEPGFWSTARWSFSSRTARRYLVRKVYLVPVHILYYVISFAVIVGIVVYVPRGAFIIFFGTVAFNLLWPIWQLVTGKTRFSMGILFRLALIMLFFLMLWSFLFRKS